MGRLTIHEIEKTASELMYYKDKLANGIFGDKIGCFDKAMEALKELQKYKDLEEQGRLITLPCPINTELYFVGEKADGTYGTHSTTLFTLDLCKSFEGQIGKGFYLTREEAIAKLKELEGAKE